MPDVSQFLNIMKRAAAEAVEAESPVKVLFGTVKSTAPLRITVDQKLELGPAQLTLCRNVTNYSVSLSVDWETEQNTHTHESPDAHIGEHTHLHSLAGNKKVIVNNGLAAGDKVILIRQQGGQKYLVWDKAAV